MIKLTNRQATALLSPAAQKLFSSEDRRFPIDAIFMILDIIKLAEVRSKLYREQLDKILDAHGGKIKPDGSISFNGSIDTEQAVEEIKKLNDIEMEYPGEKLKITDDWPNLQLNEAYIIEPLIARK